MARKKHYEISAGRAAQATANNDVRPCKPSADDARIDMAALLGPNARFTARRRIIDLSDWLDRGIDSWVLATASCLRSMLLSGSRQTASVTNYGENIGYFFEYLTGAVQAPGASQAPTPTSLSPLHIQAFTGWLQELGQARGWTEGSARSAYKSVKSVLVEMFANGFIPGDATRFFPRAALSWRGEASRQTSLSDAEQERLTRAIKADLTAIHHGRLTLKQSDVQALRLLVVAHRQGLNLTPVLEMRRDALEPGLLPGTIRIRTAKHRNKKVRSSIGRAEEQDLVFALSEGAVLQQAIASTRDLLDEAPLILQSRVWLYRSGRATDQGRVTCLTNDALTYAIAELVKRHQLVGDDNMPLRINLSRLRKSFFDRALRATDGDLAITANLMGNTPQVAGLNYASMNHARQAEAAGFMNEDYTALMRSSAGGAGSPEIHLVDVSPFVSPMDSSEAIPANTPVAACKNTLHGAHAPGDGHNHCDRYVMCLFCPSFAVVGTVDEMWRLFSFQVFAQAELKYLDEALGPERTSDEALEDLRDRYRLAIPYIDDFTRRQFVGSRVALARAKTVAALHPYWHHQMTMSRRARSGGVEAEAPAYDGHHGQLKIGDQVDTYSHAKAQ